MRKGYLMLAHRPQFNWTRAMHHGFSSDAFFRPPEFLEDVSPVTYEDVLTERHVEMRVRYEY